MFRSTLGYWSIFTALNSSLHIYQCNLGTTHHENIAYMISLRFVNGISKHIKLSNTFAMLQVFKLRFQILLELWF